MSLAWVGDTTGVSAFPFAAFISTMKCLFFSELYESDNVVRLHTEFRHVRVSYTLLNDPCFLQLEPSFLAGHPGSNYFSGAHLHDNNWAIQALSKVSLTLYSVYPLLEDIHCLYLIFDLSICLPVRTMGSHLRT